jgi:hypothetical protein
LADDNRNRTAKEVLKSHLQLRADGELDQDLERNYHPEVVVMSARAVLRGHDGVRESAHHLWRAVADGGSYDYESVLCDDRLALLEWKAKTAEFRVFCGVDAYLIEDGFITGQTIHYRVENLELGVAASVLSEEGDDGPSSRDDPNRMTEMIGPQGSD